MLNFIYLKVVKSAQKCCRSDSKRSVFSLIFVIFFKGAKKVRTAGFIDNSGQIDSQTMDIFFSKNECVSTLLNQREKVSRRYRRLAQKLFLLRKII